MRPLLVCLLALAFSLTASAQPKSKGKGGFEKDGVVEPAPAKGTADGGAKKPSAEDAAPGLVLCGFSGFALIALAVIAFIGSLLFGLMPTFIALKRDHPNMAAILAVNLLLGWTFIGWVGALVWSLTAFEKRRTRWRYED